MSELVKKFTALKKAIGGNREMMHYEETFGMPREEAAHITPPNPAIQRIIGELDFAIRLSEEVGGKYDAELAKALALLTKRVKEEGTITKSDCLAAEKLLMPMEKAAKEYKLILAGHAHIDMNWMWSWHETVAATLATFRTMIAIMNEYPDFHFSQSQASVYKIAEDFDPELANEIKTKIKEGRWEVTASAWVETDKNMPNTESLIRHIKYTKSYLRENWDIDPDSLEVDFSPDTFGHSANIPEIDLFGGVKYYYHCRALDGNQALYRWCSPSGKELLCYREQYWYNSGITPKIGAGIIDISKRSGGLKTGLVVYGVGDHGGGPTRRDIEKALEMSKWPIYPTIKFGTFREFFKEAESVRESLPLVEHELNYFAPGCYTTQSRIKMGNRASERALVNAEAMAAITKTKTGIPYSEKALEKAWQGVLFTHFHDILTGSCVQDSREHAMGLYSEALAIAQTQFTNAARALADKTDTSAIALSPQDPLSQAEGGGAGYGIDGFSSATPAPERGNGLTRIFTLFNPTASRKTEPVEITAWDWTGDLRRIKVTDSTGKELPFQKLDHSLRTYWDHKFFRFLVYVEIPPYGYTAVVLDEKENEGSYPLYYQGEHRTNGIDLRNFVLENEHIRAEFDSSTGELVSLSEKNGRKEYLKVGERGGLRFVDTECATSNAWCIGNYLNVTPLNHAVRVCRTDNGPLRQGFYAEYKIKSSTVKMNVSLDKGAVAFAVRLEVDWHEIGGKTIPVLTYELPLADVDSYMYDIPVGVITRGKINHDVPALQFGAAVSEDDTSCVAIVNESKYGYRGTADNKLISTFINSSTSPDPYPERGIHKIGFAVGIFDKRAKNLIEAATSINNKISYQPTGSHKGNLPPTGNLFGFTSEGCTISSIGTKGQSLTIRLYNTLGLSDNASFSFDRDIKTVKFSDANDNTVERAFTLRANTLSFELEPYSLANIVISFE